MRVSAAKLATLGPTSVSEFGHLLASFVVGELRKQVSWLDEQVSTGHWRTHDGDEVDYVIEFDDGRVLAFQVKANERVFGADLKGLRVLRDALGDRLTAGVALSTGLRSFTYEDRIHIVPIDRLWTQISEPSQTNKNHRRKPPRKPPRRARPRTEGSPRVSPSRHRGPNAAPCESPYHRSREPLASTFRQRRTATKDRR
jgi:hypothetical protein